MTGEIIQVEQSDAENGEVCRYADEDDGDETDKLQRNS